MACLELILNAGRWSRMGLMPTYVTYEAEAL